MVWVVDKMPEVEENPDEMLLSIVLGRILRSTLSILLTTSSIEELETPEVD